MNSDVFAFLRSESINYPVIKIDEGLQHITADEMAGAEVISNTYYKSTSKVPTQSKGYEGHSSMRDDLQ
jgi:hypothetical protein